MRNSTRDSRMDGDLRNMVMSFRVTELQTLLGYAGKCKTGRKNELQARALELVKAKNPPMVGKIKELYRSMQQTITSATNPSAASYGSSAANSGPPQPTHTQSRLYVQSSGYGGSSDKVLQGITPFMSFNNPIIKPQTLNTMPICPDVKMKRLPFYDIISELIKPTSLIPSGIGRLQEITSSFCLTPTQAGDIAASKEFVGMSMGEQKLQYSVQCQLRFCALDSSVEQDDQFPPSICVKVNGKPTPLPHLIPSNRPGVEAKRPSKPLNITNFVKLSPTMTNTVTISWASDTSKGYAMSVYLVKKLTSSDLLQRLKSKGPRPADYSRGLIKELTSKDDGDCMIAMTSLKVTIACPLGKCRMTLPCRATTCKHLQCFDANLFLQMNERKPTWVCPVCDKTTLFDDLCIDGYFQDVIKKMPAGEFMDVELMPDGSWHPLKPVIKKDKEERSPPAKRMKTDSQKSKLDQTINLDDDIVIEDDPEPSTSKAAVKTDYSDTESNTKKDSAKKSSNGQHDVIDLTLSDSDDDDDDSDDVPIVRPRRKATGNPKYNVDEDSSDSSTTTEGSAQTCRASPVAPMSPACITLDSRSPSPEDRGTNPNNGNGRSDNLSNSASGSGSDSMAFSSLNNGNRETGLGRSSSAYGGAGLSSRNDNSRSSSTTTYDYGHTYSQPTGYPLNRSNSSQPSTVPNVLYGQNYSPFSNTPALWDTTGSAGSYNPLDYRSQFLPGDFSHLDFSTMEQYRFDNPPSRSNNNSQGGYGRWP